MRLTFLRRESILRSSRALLCGNLNKETENAMTEKRLVGQNTVRPDGWDKISGRAKYAADYAMDGMLHVVMVRSEKAHAEILSIDDTEARREALVFTAADLAENIIDDIISDQPVFADKKVRFLGEPIAAVAAPTREQAKRAAALVRVTYRELPVYTEARAAIAEGTVSIHEGGNRIGAFDHTKGDPDAGFASAELVLEHTYTAQRQEHGYLEPDAGFSYMDGDTLVMISSSQNVFHDRRMAVRALGIPTERVRVISATVGGAFGGKDGHMTQLFGALVTLKTGKPAKIVFDRQESIAYTYKRHSTEMKVKIGFLADGTITAFASDVLIDTGAYIGYGFSVLGLLSEHIPGPYRINNIRLHSELCYTNKSPASAFRGFGAPQANFATESLISEAAVKLGLDPVAIRKKNALRTGDIGSLGQVIGSSCGLTEALEKLENSELWQRRKTETDPNVGYGLAAGHLSCGFGKAVPDSAEVTLRKAEDGSYELAVGFTELGQGGIGSLTAIAADALGVDAVKVRLIMGDTACTCDCGATAASRTTFIAGNAILRAAEEFRVREAAGEANFTVRGSAQFPETENMHSIGAPHVMYTFAVQAVRVVVDPLTGEVRVTDAAAVTEAGTIVNPMQLAGQVQGGFLQSMGYTLSEACTYGADGTMKNDSFASYLLPTAADAPHITAETVELYEQSGPMGVKGAAESPTVPTAAAINAAIFDATGKWHYALPITPQDIL